MAILETNRRHRADKRKVDDDDNLRSDLNQIIDGDPSDDFARKRREIIMKNKIVWPSPLSSHICSGSSPAR